MEERLAVGTFKRGQEGRATSSLSSHLSFRPAGHETLAGQRKRRKVTSAFVEHESHEAAKVVRWDVKREREGEGGERKTAMVADGRRSRRRCLGYL